jgi:hypothetical protein
METFLKETDMSLLGCVVIVVVVGFALFKLELEDRPDIEPGLTEFSSGLVVNRPLVS